VLLFTDYLLYAYFVGELLALPNALKHGISLRIASKRILGRNRIPSLHIEPSEF